MKTLRQMMGSSPRQAIAVAPGDTVVHALKVMADNSIGAVLVMEGEKLVGIFSERDYARKLILCGKSSLDTKVSEIMTDKVIYASPEHTVDQVMVMMSEKHIRHMPVLDAQQKLLTVFSIGDMVKETIEAQAFKIEQLERYITG